MKVNVEVIMTPEEMDETEAILKEESNFYNTIEELVFEWLEADFADFVDHFDIKVKEDKDE